MFSLFIILQAETMPNKLVILKKLFLSELNPGGGRISANG